MTNRQKQILHILQNPQKWTDEYVQQAQLDAADELYKLWNTTELDKKVNKGYSREDQFFNI